MRLEQIGFYTLSDERAKNVSNMSPMYRGEILLTNKCNFQCPYCRRVGPEDMNPSDVMRTLHYWFKDGLKNVRFSGGEPTLDINLEVYVVYCRCNGVKNIAVSTNGSAFIEKYDDLIRAGVNDFSVSLDACCASTADIMAGKEKVFERVCKTIRYLSRRVYTTVGVVLTGANMREVYDIIKLADSLGVQDIRLIPAAQEETKVLEGMYIDEEIIRKYPILKYRLNNAAEKIPVRGLTRNDSPRCYLALDDSAVSGVYHYPCIIYLREGGKPIGTVYEKMRTAREQWVYGTNRLLDPICKANCLDVCVAYNRKVRDFREQQPRF